MSTRHERLADLTMRKWMQTPPGASALQQVMAGLHEGRYDGFWVDSIGQIFRHDPYQWPMEQILAFAVMHADLCMGRTGLIDVETEDTPTSDKRREENASVLSKLPEPFEAEVDMTQYGAECDGELRWTAPIRVNVAEATEVAPSGAMRSVMKVVHLPPGAVPLEIGTSDPSRTILHVRERRGVARWPYHHEKLRIFLDLTSIAPDVVPTFETVAAVRQPASTPLPHDDRSET